MKNKMTIFIKLIAVFVILYNSISAQDSNAALNYNNDMIAIQTSVDDAITIFVNSLDTFDPDLMVKERKNTLKAIKKANKDISAMEDFDGKDFKNEMKEFVKMYKEIATKELTKIMKLIIKRGENFNESDWDTYDKYYESALQKYDAAFDRFNKFQKEFADKWYFTIEGDDSD